MRERIKTELSDYLRNEVLLPAMVKEYKAGFNEMILLNKAYAVMLIKEGIIDEKTAQAILGGLAKVGRELKVEDLDGKYEELYYNIEHHLFERIGIRVGGKLHTGRSRNDVYATLGRMEVRKSLWEVLEKVIDFQEMLLKIASENVETVMTGYTHMQPAQPITLAHYYVAVSNTLNRDFERLKNAYRTTNLCPYGAAALAGTGFPINRHLLKDLLGFEKLLTNSLDGVGARDYILEVESAYTIMMVNVSRVAEDHFVWSTDEFGILDIGGEIALSSSIMPQKKNPCSLELAKAKAAHGAGALTSTLFVLKNTPFSLCMDLFEVFGLFWEAHLQVLQSLGLLMETIRHSKIHKEKALERTKENFSTVTALADYLVSRFGISFSEAHSIVGGMVEKVIVEGSFMDGMRGSILRDVSRSTIQKELELSDEEIRKVLDPYENVQSKKVVGGTSRDSVQTMLDEADSYVDAEKTWLGEEMDRVDRAYKRIEAEEERVFSR